VSSAAPDTAWSAFTHRFFSAPNELEAVGDEAVESAVAQAEAAWLATPPAPFFLPVNVSGWTYWYAVCPDREQSLWIRDLIRANVGSWIDGQPVPADSDMPMDEAIRALTGPLGYAFRVRLPRNTDSEAQVRESLRRLARSLASRPHRRIQLTWPLGRLIGDLSDACAAGAEARAEDALAVLEQDHRLARPNKLFLRLQYLAAFERWDRLRDMEELPDLIRIDRPVLASDALARLAMARLTPTAGLEEFRRATADLGCLIGSVAMIRSAAGAQYYTYWSLASGEASEAVAARLLEAGWLNQVRDRAGLAPLLPPGGLTGVPGDTAASMADLQQALDSGRLDTAVDVLALLTPSVDQLPVLVDLVTRTLSTHSIRVLEHWREALGASAIEDLLAGRPADGQRDIAFASESLGDALLSAFVDDLPASERSRMLEELSDAAVPRLMEAGVLREVVEIVRPLSRSVSPILLGDLIDLLMDMERDLFAAAGDVSGIQDLRLIVVESWALGDESGDRHRATRLLDLVSRTLSAGVSATIFSEIAESLRAGWDPFLTDAGLPLGLEAIELLAASQPRPNEAVLAFASAILSRIGAHNARRIEAAYLETARALAPEFGLELAIPAEPEETQPAEAGQVRPPDGTFVAIYSLMEPAAARAAAIIRRWYPEIRVETLAGKVASDALRSAATNADVLVIADRAAAHAATDALKAARGTSPICYASGKGTASLIKAVLNGFDESFGGLLAETQHGMGQLAVQ
jgi:hypothetical protein